jgi:hypothetical protein
MEENKIKSIEVYWDNVVRAAYVMRNGYEVHFEGILDRDTLFVNLGDLAKLGYTVFCFVLIELQFTLQCH